MIVKKILLLLLLCLPVFLQAQITKKGIRFEDSLSWPQLQAQAKKEQKFIFVDCFATWCGPCKLMDQQVYINDTLANYMNEHFLSVKVQMDSTADDNEQAKRWYQFSQQLTKAENIEAYPTFLFFSPDGTLVHRGLGYMNAPDFRTLAMNATSVDKQYYTTLKKFEAGQLDYAAMPQLSKLAKSYGQTEIAAKIAKDYLENYLDNLEPDDFYAHVDREMMYPIFNVISSKDKVFRWLYPNGARMDEAMQNKGLSQNVVKNVVNKEMVQPALWPNKVAIHQAPDWETLTRAISEKYDQSIADRVILTAKLKWYHEKKDWPMITKYTIKHIELTGMDTSGFGRAMMNNLLYEVIFQHSTNKTELAKATHWMKAIVSADPSYQPSIDTYANLLYKSGKRKEAIEWEKKAMLLEQAAGIKGNYPPDKTFSETLLKMQKGIPTW